MLWWLLFGVVGGFIIGRFYGAECERRKARGRHEMKKSASLV